MLKIVAADLDAYRSFRVEQRGRIETIREIKSDIPMQTIKRTWKIPAIR